MFIYTFETKPMNGWDDFGGTHFNVVAKNEREAWRKACQLEDRKNIIRIERVKAGGTKR